MIFYRNTEHFGALNCIVEYSVMRTKIPLAPREPDVTVHIVLNDFGPLGSAYVETDEAEADEATIIENILSGQYSHPMRVVAFNTAGRMMSPRILHVLC